MELVRKEKERRGEAGCKEWRGKNVKSYPSGLVCYSGLVSQRVTKRVDDFVQRIWDGVWVELHNATDRPRRCVLHLHCPVLHVLHKTG